MAALAIFADFREVDDALPGPEVLRRLARVKGLPLTVVARGLVLGTISVPRSTR
ncbi:hypothetical protein [Iamia sp.]|uniref:hypothetical protein n=1 Tax=Iamia sp. TaxID=2722710 RepID=UPI002BA0AACF|nr:hypothetical protein [Iamia sp.]HXH59078.1 hypothetical protein [Iamia sp.]